MSTERFRIALIGAGRMGQTHLAALERADRVVVTAIVEPVAPTRAELAARGYRTHSDVAELLEAGEFDGVLIAAPSDQHLGLVRTLAGAGMPMLCEKPVGVTTTHAVEAAAAVKQAGVPFQVGYWRRFVPALRDLRDRIARGELGKINQISCLQWDAEPPSPAFRAHSGGILVDMAVHELDQTRWLTGQDLSWLAAVPTASEVEGDPDAAAIVAQLSGGTILTVSVGRTFPPGDCCWVEVFGTAGYERIEFVWGVPGDEVFRAALVAQAEAFAAAVRGGEAAGAGAADAVAALSAAERAREALDERRSPSGA
ncbi:MAG TPA: Gfo/Idh/MocA family oxidoreductase [Solirubrobacteraceae bacterium]